MRVLNNLRMADIGKVLISLEDFTTSTIFPIATKVKEVNQEEADWEVLRLKYDLEE